MLKVTEDEDVVLDAAARPQSGVQKKLDLKLDLRPEPVLGTPSSRDDTTVVLI
jgi:hypothetical protein